MTYGPPTQMYYVYILKSLKDGRTYTGYTNNLERRLVEHNSGQNRSTKSRKPFVLLYFEQVETLKEAKSRELWWKTVRGRAKMKDLFI